MTPAKQKQFQAAFPGHDEGESIKAVMRRHWIRLFGHAVWFFVQTLIPIVAAILLIFFTTFRLDYGSAGFILSVLGVSLYYLFVTLFFFADLVDYHLDIWVVTDKRVVSIEQRGLFHRVVAEQPILKVQDVTHEVKGQLQTMLDFGNVHIQTAGEQERFVFEDVPHPDLVAKLILKTHEESIHTHDLKRAQLFQEKPPMVPQTPNHESQV